MSTSAASPRIARASATADVPTPPEPPITAVIEPNCLGRGATQPRAASETAWMNTAGEGGAATTARTPAASADW